MKGKYKHRILHAAATVRREWLRFRLTTLIDWEPLHEPESGCTAIIGVCSRLPDILIANLRCLRAARWPELKYVIVVLDCVQSSFPFRFVENVLGAFPEFDLRFLYYSTEQSSFVEECKLPYVYAWLSWCIGLKHAKTSEVLFHDYDALVFNRALGDRYGKFIKSKAKVQGVSWYFGNGIDKGDQLATTYEAFMDTSWLRSAKPVTLFNRVRVIEGRSVDFDITLERQYSSLAREERMVVPMRLQDLVHPSQMIYQYTMFRRYPGAALPCFSIPIIPFFSYVSGRREFIEHATRALHSGRIEDLDLLADGTRYQLIIINRRTGRLAA